MKKIGFDLDDVLLNFSDPFREFLNNKYGTNVKREELKEFYIERFFGISDEIIKEEVSNFLHHDDHKNTLPVFGSTEVIDRLANKYTLEIITAKPDYLAPDTEVWLSKYFPNKFNYVHFTNHFQDSHKKRKKSDVCVSEKISILVEDSLENAKDVSSVSIPVLLFDTPWNQTNELPDLVKRVHSWEEIEKEIENLL